MFRRRRETSFGFKPSIRLEVGFDKHDRGEEAMKLTRMIALCSMLVLAIGGCSRIKDATLERGIDLFMENRLQLALPMLETASRMCRDNPDAYAWLAECRRRLQKFDEAADAGYAALALDAHHAFAHAVLGDLFTPHLSGWDRADPDSAWYHLKEAVRYDPEEGGAWSSLWIQAMKRGEREVEKRAAVQMIDSGFLSKPILAYNRWQLEHLPENAILLTNGDMDTYPSIALQEKEGLRPDVAVVNLSLLNLPWYAELLAERHGVRLPFNQDDLESKRAYKNEDGEIVTVSHQIVAGWLAMNAEGSLGRPLCVAVTVDKCHLDSEADARFVLCGPYFEIKGEPTGVKNDMSRMAQSVEDLDLTAFEGSFTTPVDRSPVRRGCTDKLASNITAAMLRYTESLVDADRWDEAKTTLAMAEDFDSRILAGGAFAGYMDSLRLRVDYHNVQ
jgi:tetratricopeptide (TPR) repeat protein